MSDFKEIWLQPDCCDADDRSWCQDDAVACDVCGADPVRYVLSTDAPIQTAIDAAVPKGWQWGTIRTPDESLPNEVWRVELWHDATEQYYIGEGPTIDAAIADAVAKITPPE